jgi:hypothetical protein
MRRKNPGSHCSGSPPYRRGKKLLSLSPLEKCPVCKELVDTLENGACLQCRIAHGVIEAIELVDSQGNWQEITTSKI